MITVLVIALIVLGPNRLPDVARSIGRGVREFRSALDRPDEDDEPEAAGVPVDEADPYAGAEPGRKEADPDDPDRTEAEPDEPYQKEADSSEPSSSSRDLV
jgi:sec-independent protein translocase protein TatA